MIRVDRLAAVVAVGLLMFGASLSRAEEQGQRWALLIGVNDYANLNALKYCQRDAEALRDRLLEAGFAKDNVFLLTSDAPSAQRLPMKANIERQLKVVLGLAEKGDTVLVSFSGHGISLDGHTYLCPTEADVEEPASTMVPLDLVYNSLNNCHALQKMLWVDACRNDPRRGGSKDAYDKSVEGISRSLSQPPEGVLVLASCTAGQRSWEDDTFQHGVFMHYLLEGLAGKADQESGDRNERVSLLELYKYANLNTKRMVARQWTSQQTPELFGHITGDFDLGQSLQLPQEMTNSIGMKLRLIPAGEFLMGSRSAEETAKAFAKYEAKAEWFKDEQPEHRVGITKPFYLGQYEVTVGQFQQFVSDASYKTEAEKDGKGGNGYDAASGKFEQKPEYTWRNPSFEQTDEHPVVNVSWNDAVAFCEWLSRKEGRTYRLPTESELEYACRAGTATRYSCGDDEERLVEVGNVADATFKTKIPNAISTIRANDGYVFTAPVGRFRANAFDLYDMHGNVFEWCADWYSDGYYATSPADDPKGPDSGEARVLRGGSWVNGPDFVRSACRSGYSPGDRYNSTGIRVARTP